MGADRLPDADLPGPGRGAGGRQVDEIDAGHKEDTQGDKGKDIDVGDIPIRLQLEFVVGAQVDILEGLDEVPGYSPPEAKNCSRVIPAAAWIWGPTYFFTSSASLASKAATDVPLRKTT